ncbi:hypothetical protein, partial [Planococcus sp. CAU13]|uniref:hypothetical protein n=1 Tax=Planococcus sp. CAU13 TaxID=1541197 RepID=UPI001F1D6B9E
KKLFAVRKASHSPFQRRSIEKVTSLSPIPLQKATLHYAFPPLSHFAPGEMQSIQTVFGLPHAD